ncbi:hypothetical protein MLD38_029532 [Melastoma candidum]|uniref:Uncharacterized protein n=1 Tax=Melastoma candidum TaxID=119954 RepID=A0ACB9N6K5_9MYRT|nr:hypothetical protein MLD38_029532 [Melastoma candidum]
MAATCTKPPCAVRHLTFSVARPSPNAVVGGVKMIGSGVSPGRRRGPTTRLLRIRSTKDNKASFLLTESEPVSICTLDSDEHRPGFRHLLQWQVFEDQSEGIVCYVDDAGETVCEGYDDERPRFRREPPNRRIGEAKIIGLLQRNWIQLVDARDVYPTDNHANGAEIPELEDQSNWNRYNSN